MSYTLLPDGSHQWTKDPDDIDTWGFDVRDDLASGEVVTGVSVVDVTGGITVTDPQFSGTRVFALASGGTVGVPASFTLRWTKTGGKRTDRSIRFRVVQR